MLNGPHNAGGQAVGIATMAHRQQLAQERACIDAQECARPTTGIEAITNAASGVRERAAMVEHRVEALLGRIAGAAIKGGVPADPKASSAGAFPLISSIVSDTERTLDRIQDLLGEIEVHL